MMRLCKCCIAEIKSRGELVFVNYDEMIPIEEAEELEVTCEWCDEYDDLFSAMVDHPWG